MSAPDHTPSPTQPLRLALCRVSTEDQAHDDQVDELKAAGCRIFHEEHIRRLAIPPGAGKAIARDRHRSPRPRALQSQAPIFLVHFY
jgi:hypothetical protein